MLNRLELVITACLICLKILQVYLIFKLKMRILSKVENLLN